MAIQYKDYYEILGVSRNANDEEIRRAFRKLARVYHPDKTGGNSQAEDKFKEINEAYEVLGDPDKRQRYDDFGNSIGDQNIFDNDAWSFTDHSNISQDRSKPGHFTFHGTGFSEFFDQLFAQTQNPSRTGKENRQSYHRERIRPETNERQDSVDQSESEDKGEDLEAEILVTLDEISRGAVRSITVKRGVFCQTCFGVGNYNGRACEQCRGTGHSIRAGNCKVKIPKGVREGSLLRLAGQGEESARSGPSGDLYLKVKYARHPDYKVVGDSLEHSVELAPWEAVLGTTAMIGLLDGTKLSIRIPAGTQNGQKLRIRGKGLPRPDGSEGDLMINVTVQVPKTTSEREKNLWGELARASNFHPREVNN